MKQSRGHGSHENITLYETLQRTEVDLAKPFVKKRRMIVTETCRDPEEVRGRGSVFQRLLRRGGFCVSKHADKILK